MHELTGEDYQDLLAFRTRLREFLHWSAASARRAGLTPAQHQLLLAIKGHLGGAAPTVGDLAGYLLLRPHSTVELIDRAEAARLVERCGDDGDGRLTRIRLTPSGEHRLAQLAAAHLDELHSLAPILDHLAGYGDEPPAPGTSPAQPGPAGR
jgi:DNA-binding MarR family transcriptional regulator